jgi:hypothetical protein
VQYVAKRRLYDAQPVGNPRREPAMSRLREEHQI